MALYENIKKYAKLRGKSLQEVATSAGLSKNVIYQYKTAMNPSLENLTKIANVLGVTTSDLLGKPETKSDVPMTDNQKLIAYSIDPDISDEEREAIIEMVKQAMKFRKRL